MTAVLDASAILAFLQDESGADLVESAFGEDPRCSAANWSEVAQRILAADRDWNLWRMPCCQVTVSELSRSPVKTRSGQPTAGDRAKASLWRIGSVSLWASALTLES